MLRYGFIAAGNIIRSMHRGAEMNEDYDPAEIGIYDINEEVRKDYAARGYKTFDSMKELIDLVCNSLPIHQKLQDSLLMNWQRITDQIR